MAPVPLLLVDFNWCVLAVIRHPCEYNHFSEFCEPFRRITEAERGFGSPEAEAGVTSVGGLKWWGL